MIRIAICDDEMEFSRMLREKIENYLDKNKIQHEIAVYNSGQRLWEDVEDGYIFDILCMDIEMEGTNGLESARKIRKMLPHVLLIFVSSYQKYVFDTFELNTFRFIPKTQMDLRLESALRDAVKKLEYENEKYYVIENKKQIEKISVRDIVSISKDGKNSVIKTYRGDIRVRKSLAQVFAELPQGEFAWINRGVICNLAQVMRIDGEDVLLKNGDKLPVVRGKILELKSTIRVYFAEREGLD